MHRDGRAGEGGLGDTGCLDGDGTDRCGCKDMRASYRRSLRFYDALGMPDPPVLSSSLACQPPFDNSPTVANLGAHPEHLGQALQLHEGARIVDAVPQGSHFRATSQQGGQRALGFDVALLQHDDVVGAA